MGNYITKNNLARFWEDCLSTFRMNGGQILWQNPNPTSDMSATTITVPNLSNYKYITIEYILASNCAKMYMTAKCEQKPSINITTNWNVNNTIYVLLRSLNIGSGNTIQISDCVYRNFVESSSGTANNTLLITAIYGTNDMGYIANASALDAYPIGSIYLSVNSTSPASLFGGTWEALNSGNQCYISCVEKPPVITSTEEHSVLTGTGLFMRDDNGNLANNGATLGTGRATVGGSQKTYVGYTGSNPQYSGSGLHPTNLYAELSNGVSVYMWKRTA